MVELANILIIDDKVKGCRCYLFKGVASGNTCTCMHETLKSNSTIKYSGLSVYEACPCIGESAGDSIPRAVSVVIQSYCCYIALQVKLTNFGTSVSLLLCTMTLSFKHTGSLTH